MNLLKGKLTYLVGVVMLVHAGSTLLLNLLNGHALDQLSLTEALNGLGLLGLRRAVSNV